MKKIIFIAIVLLNSSLVYAQNTVGNIEGGLFVGLNSATDKCGFNSIGAGASFGGEIRYNFRDLPLDVGLQCSASTVNRQYKTSWEAKDKTTSSSCNFMIVGDYNFNRGEKFSIFIGLGAGLASFKDSSPARFDGLSYDFVGNKKHSLCLLPRIGIELFNHLRFSVEYKIEERANSNIAFNIGFVIGGGAR